MHSQHTPRGKLKAGGKPAAAHGAHSGQKTKLKSPHSASAASAAAASTAAAAAPAHAAPTLLGNLRSADSAFAALLGSAVTPKEFFTRHFEKAPLHVSRSAADGGRNFYAGLFSKALFDAYLRKHADELAYGFNLNVCVCSEEGRKIDMNPRAEGAEDDGEEGEGDEEESAEDDEPAEDDEEEVAAPVSKKPKPAAAPARAPVRAGVKKAHAEEEEEEVETMTIAQALKLAESQRAMLKPQQQAAADDDEEEEEDEGEQEDQQIDGEADDAEGSEEDEEGGDDEEEQLDGTSVSTVRKYAPVTYADYQRLFEEGCTVQALQPQQYSHAMWLLLTHLEEYFGGLAGANCYITPPNSQGLAPHYDDVEVFVLQLEGSKTWSLYHPAQSLPREHSGDFDRSEIGDPFQVVTLQPGDLLYLPRGVIHEARTSSSMSSHMTVSVYQKTAHVDFLGQLFPLALKEAFDSDETEEFRRGLPVQYLSYMGSQHAMEREMEEGAPEALGISVEQARSQSGRHKPQRSTALLGQSRAQLQEAFRAQIDSLLKQLHPILMDKLDECADAMSADFMLSRLPPAPPLPAPGAKVPAPAPKRTGAAAQYPEELGVPPVLPGAQIRLLHPSALRMVVVPAESDDEEDEDEEEEGERSAEEEEARQARAGHIVLTHSLHNSREHHLDGRFPPNAEAARIQLPLYYAPALLQLLHAPRGSFIPVSSLRLEFGQLTDADGNPADAQAERDSQLELANTLWLSQLLQTRMPDEHKANGKPDAEKTPNSSKGIKRKAAHAADAAPAAEPSRPPKHKKHFQKPAQR